MYTVTLEDFSISQIAQSGQCFRMLPLNGGEAYFLVAGEHYLEMSQEGSRLTLSCGREEWENRWSAYFDCGTDYKAVKEMADPEDCYLQEAIKKGWGIRILRQDVWETIITFIISQQNNIKRIRTCVETLCETYGEQKVNERGESYFLFPQPKALARASEEELRALHLGYRSKYIKKTAQMIESREILLCSLQKMGYEEAKNELMKLCGVGLKVAECICLFGLHHTEAFPIDTHIQKILKKHYPGGFPFERYAGCAGIMQQYLFFHDLL